MKKILFLTAFLALILPVLALGCATPPNTPSVPPVNGGQQAKMIEFSDADFQTQKHITKDIELIVPGSLIVSLYSNQTTGFKWSENAVISQSSVIEQESHNYVSPQTGTPVLGAAGKEVWVFNSLKPGSATIKLSYGRPWEGGEKDELTLTVNVIVK